MVLSMEKNWIRSDINDINIIGKITQELIVYIKDREYINRGQKIL